MSATTISFLTNDNVLTVVNAYLKAIDETSFEDMVTLVNSVLKPYKPRDAAKIFDIPLQRIYEYRREDWLERHTHNKPSLVFIKDFVKIIMIGNAIM